MKTNKPKSASHKSGHGHVSHPAKVFDVAPPGKTAPSSTTRPLIVTDRPMIKDPMVSLGESSARAPAAVSGPVEPAATVRRIGVNVQPPSESAAELDPPPTPLLPTHFDDEPMPVAEPAAPVPSIASEPPVPSPVAAPPQPTEPAQPTPHQHTPATTAGQESLVDIAARNRAASMRLAVVGAILIIVVAIGCVDAMLDAGALQLNGVPHTHFFKQ